MIRETIRRLIGRTLAGRPGALEALLKLATYPRLHAWREANPAPFDAGGDREKLYGHVLETLTLRDRPIDYWEFGVHRGDSMRWWVKANRNPDSRFHGFDSFQGLPEDWLKHRPAGAFTTGGATPDIDDPRVAFHVGWFHETLPGFLRSIEDAGRVRIVHMDADLYRSTIYVLMNIGHLLKPGDVLMFDEFSDSIHEFRAFEDFTSIFRKESRVIGGTANHHQTALLLT